MRETVREMNAAGDVLVFGDVAALATNVRQRVLTSQYMRRSQGSTPHDMAFSYPNSHGDGTEGVDPKVNDAAASFWNPAQGSGAYYFDPTPAGRADAYQAIVKLFVEHREPAKRTLVHCDYVVSILRLRAYAESIGATRFNQLVASGRLPLRLKWNLFTDLESVPTGAGNTPPLKEVTVASRDDLIVGDHVVFYNHPSYDALIQVVGGVWRLENAIVIDRRGGELRYQGHGYFSPVNEDHLIQGMLRQYNLHVDAALAIVHRTEHGSAAQRQAASDQLARHYPNVHPKAAGRGWEIRGTGLFDLPVVRDLKHLTAAEAPGLRHPVLNSIQVRRPTEARL